MAICVKLFALLALLCVVSALPANVNEPKNNLASVESSPITDSASSDGLTRDKRHHRYGGYGYGK